MGNRKICVVTGSRAEYGLLEGLVEQIRKDSDLQLQIIATGMHLSPEFGSTYRDIENNGFVIDHKVEMLLSSDTPTGISKSIGLGVIGFSDAFQLLRPDLIVLLGDRYEIFSAAIAAMTANIPIAHIHGGESTEGAIDEAIRHAISKMAHIHFVSTEVYKNRVIQLGEQPNRVFNVGALGIDNILRLNLLSKQELERLLEFSFGEVNFLVTYHPVTLGTHDSVETHFQNLLDALEEFVQAKIIITKPNSDTHGRVISQRIDAFALRYPDKVLAITSMGSLRYLSSLPIVDVVIGNSSSGIIEVPWFKKPTVNIGSRQRGRLQGVSVIDCGETKEEIVNAIDLALSANFRESLLSSKSLYGEGNTAVQIKEVLKQIPLSGIIQKSFYDLKM
jgi:GDP/UDP-N,N'-diacetylbacillosamine 2-epimerase (hydrolysing)